MIDGRRRFGNGRLLPAGPLREPASRARDVDAVVINGGSAAAGEVAMVLEPEAVVALGSGERSARLRTGAAAACMRWPAIGDPARFFATLRAVGIDPVEHPLPDHAPLGAADLASATTCRC